MKRAFNRRGPQFSLVRGSLESVRPQSYVLGKSRSALLAMWLVAGGTGALLVASPAWAQPTNAKTPTGGTTASDEASAKTLAQEAIAQYRSAREKGDFAGAMRVLEEVLDKYPKMFPDWKVEIYYALGQAYIDSDQGKAVIPIYDQALLELAPQDAKDPKAAPVAVPVALEAGGALPSPFARVHLVRGKVRVLMSMKMASQAKVAFKRAMPAIVLAGQEGRDSAFNGWLQSRYESARAVDELAKATWGKNRFESLSGDITRYLSEAPAMLDEQYQRRQPALPTPLMYTQMQGLLSKAKKLDEELSWAKLCFVTCDFDADAIARSTLMVGQAWGEADKTDAVLAFDKAQADVAAPNPLKEVPLPTLDKVKMRASLAQNARQMKAATTSAAERERAVHDSITTLMAMGEPADLGLAMSLARRLWQSAPEKPEGAREICRVFKAADCGVARSNAFLQYLERKGAGENPLDGFFKDYPEQQL